MKTFFSEGPSGVVVMGLLATLMIPRRQSLASIETHNFRCEFPFAEKEDQNLAYNYL